MFRCTFCLHSRPSVFFRVATIAGLWCALFLAGASAQEDEEAERVRDFLEVEHALSLNFVTPHTAWAKPYAQGPVKALFFAPWFQGSTDAREIIELMQRFDLDAQAVYYMPGSRLVGDGRPDWYGGDPLAGTNRALRLLDSGNEVLVFINLNPGVLPADVKARVIAKVRAGAGLVVVGDFPDFSPEGAVALEAQGLPTGRYLTLGEGRVALLPPRVNLIFQLGWDTTYDYQAADQGRVLLWAAKKEPAAALRVAISARELDRGVLPSESVTVSWNGMAPEATINVSLRRWDGERISLAELEAGGEQSTNVTIPRLCEGGYHVDAIAYAGGTVLNWATTSLRVNTALHVTTVDLEKTWAEIGETVNGRIPLDAAPAADQRVMLRVFDRFGRVLVQQDLALSGIVAPFSFTVEPWMPMLLRVEGVLVDPDGEVSSAYAYLQVTQRHRGQFNFVMWNIAGGGLAPYTIDSLAKYGVTSVLMGTNAQLAMSQGELTYVPYAASFRASSHTTTAMLDPATGFLKSGCVHDPEGMRQTLETALENVRPARELGVLAYSLGDENAVRASCLSPHCLKAYREYLLDVYSDITALNEEWGTRYASFDAIELSSEGELPAADAPEWFKEYFADLDTLHRTDNEGAKDADLDRQVQFGFINDEVRALQAGNFARWYDRQAFQNYSYVHWCKLYQEAFLKIDPQAWTGFEGTDSFTIRKFTTRSRQGGDIDAFVRELDYFGPYEGPANEVVRSIAPPGFPMGNWIGYDPDPESLLHKYWSQIADNMNTVQWWRFDNLDGYHGYIMPTLDLFPETRELFDDTAIVRDGLGTLLMQSSMHDDGLAMLYSLPSTYIAHFDGNDTYGDYKRDHAEWHHLIHGAGLQFRYVTDRMLRLGEFDPARYKVLILPLSFALDPKEAEVIRAFVEGGGTVIADVRPALYDGHCKPLDQGSLDDLFGIARTGKRDAMEVDRLRVDGELNGAKVRLQWGNWHGKDIYPRMKVDPNVTLTTGKPLGQAYHIHYWTGLESPLCIVNEYGKGRAILLNFSIFDAPAGKFMADLLAAAGVEPAVRVTQPYGRPLRDVEVTRWDNGKAGLLALLGTYEGDAFVRLPEPRHVYNLKKHQYLGLLQEFTTPLRPNRASFFALHPEAIAPPEVLVPEGAVAPGSVAQAKVRIPGAVGGHPVTLRATNPAGDEVPWLNEQVIAGAGQVAVPLPIAQNDPAGTWRIRATDLISNQSTEVPLIVR